MPDRRIRVTVTGYVQGVGFRAHCQREALALGVAGWVRNRWDGGVEAFFEGSDEAVEAMLSWCHLGPPAANVTRVVSEEAPEEPPHRTFSIRS